MRLPANKVGALNKLKQTFAQLEQEFEREPTPEEVAEVMEISSDEVGDYIKTGGRHISLDAPIGAEEEGNMMNIMRDKDSKSPESGLISDSLKKEVKRILNALSPREAIILSHFFGLNGNDYLSFEEIGQKLNLSRERVRQLKEKAIKKLRKGSHNKLLKAYL